MAQENIEEVIKKVILGENFLAENTQEEIVEDEDTSDAETLSEGDEDEAEMPEGDEDGYVDPDEIVDDVEELEEAKDEDDEEDEESDEEDDDEEDEEKEGKKGKMPAFMKGKFGKKKEKVEEAASDYASEKIAKTANGKTPKIAEPTNVSAEKNRSTIKAKPSDAKAEAKYPSLKKEDIAAMFSGEQLSEEFKAQAATLFEAHLNERVHQIEEQLKAQYEDLLEQHTVAVTEELVERIDDYLNYVVEEWMSENRLAVENGLRTEITENFIANLKGLFAESYIEVPADKTDLFESAVEQVETLDTELKTQVDKNIELSEEVEQLKCEIIFREISEGLADTDIEKLRRLAEDLEFDTVEQFAEKVTVLRENLDTIGTTAEETVDSEALEESYEETSEASPLVEAYARSLSRTRD
jgi:hypothetical protein